MTAAVALAGVVVVVVLNAPANWLARDLQARTGGVLLLADADGTIWSGSAVLGIAAPAGSVSIGATDARLALPGRITWRLRFERALAPVLHLTHDGMLAQPLAVRAADGGLAVDAGTATLPAALLVLAGPPFNTLRPAGRATLRWGPLKFAQDGSIAGAGSLELAGLAIALSPVRPLGTYQVDWTSDVHGVAWQLTTVSGPLAATGGGVWNDRRQAMRVVLRAASDAPPATRAQLAPLLDVIGRRGSEEAVVEAGTP